MTLYIVLDCFGQPNNIEAFIQGDTVMCKCDFLPTFDDILLIEKRLGITKVIERSKMEYDKDITGKLLVSWTFLSLD